MQKVIPDVEIRGVSKQYGSNVVLDNISLEVRQGELLTLLGPSGCGKTTTLNAIAGFLHPDQGELYIKGKKMNGVPPYKRDLGMVFQTYSLFPHMTVYQNLDFGLELRKVAKDERKRRMDYALELVRMTGLEQRYPRELSGGQRQRVAIARALVVQPTLLLLDEPLSNLDAKLRHELRIEIKRLQKELGVTTIFVTHDQDEALSMSDRIVVMNQGKIEQIGTPTEIYQKPTSEFVFQFIGSSNCLRGTVESVGERRVGVQIGGHWEVELEENHMLGADRTYRIGDEVKLYIRPEAVTAEDMSSAKERGDQERIIHRATITQLSYLGSLWEIEVSVEGNTMQIVRPVIESNWSPGSEVLVEWKQSDMRIVKKQ